MLFNAPPDSSSPEIIRMLRASSGFQMLNASDFLIQPLLREPVLPTTIWVDPPKSQQSPQLSD
jgi:hypothetical protein